MVDMADRTLELLFQFLRQNGDRLSKRAREGELAAMSDGDPPYPRPNITTRTRAVLILLHDDPFAAAEDRMEGTIQEKGHEAFVGLFDLLPSLDRNAGIREPLAAGDLTRFSRIW